MRNLTTDQNNSPMATAFGSDKVINRKTLKPFVKRDDRHGLINLAGHGAALGATGYLLALSLGSWWVVPVMLAHGFVMALLFAPAHECSHGTAFRSRWLNETVFWMVSLIYLVPPTFFRYAHAAHHTYTQIRGNDPDMIMPREPHLRHYLVYVSALPFWRRNIGWYLSHAAGRIDPAQRHFVPETELSRVVFEARLIIALYAGIAAAAVYFGSWAPVIFWILPRLVGEPFMRWVRVAEHAGCAESGDLSDNTRTTRAPGWLHFLYWNMSYHAEHHIAPMVPFHALPRLHETVRDSLFPVADGYFQVHAGVLRQLIRNGREARNQGAGATV